MRAVLVALLVLSVAAPAYGDGFDDWEAGWSGTDLAPSYQIEYDAIDVFRCPGGGPCESTPLPSADVGDSAPGTVFEGRWFDDGRVVHVARTPVWLGAPTLTRPPALQGRPVVGGVVTLVPGRWTGGWGAPWGVRTYDQVYVCRNPDASDCFILDPDFPALLETRWQGWYAFASSSFYSGHTNAIPVLGGSPVYPYAQGRIYRSRLHVTSEPLGPIAPSAPPAASIRERAIRRDGWLRVGRVTCAAHCRLTVTVSSRGRRVFRETWTTIGTEALRALPRRGTLRVQVSVDGKLLATGTSRWR